MSLLRVLISFNESAMSFNELDMFFNELASSFNELIELAMNFNKPALS